ncbi:MAG: hypothetical protein QME46_00455 [Thermoanaerobacteraceae bacterium]|nr:hypothetical protein [Thermoanaerobacteraceae bacterium]
MGLIRKIPKSAVPKEFLERAKLIAEQTGQRQINFYTVIPLEEVADDAEQIAKEMLDNGYSSIKTMGRTLVANIFGEAFAANIYGNLIQESEYSRNVQEEIEKFVIEEITRKGYVTMNDIFRKRIYANGGKIKKELKYVYYKRLIPIMVQKYGFEYRKANKELRERFGLDGYSYVLFRKTA